MKAQGSARVSQRALKPGHSAASVAVGLLVLLLSIGGARALADQGSELMTPDETALVAGPIEGARPPAFDLTEGLTDLGAAEELPHRDLGREQAVDLLERVFGPELQSAAGVFDGLKVEEFVSDYAAIVPATIESSGEPVTLGDPNGDTEGQPVLLESTLPLRTQGPGGSEAVDLSLEPVEGGVQSAAPLVEVGIPNELGEGIELPEVGVRIELAGAPQERSPSIIEESVAAYPNVATDTDLAVAATPTGVETLTTLRSPAAPQTQTFHLSLPQGADLSQHDGGAQITKAGEVLINIPAPSAIDAAGAPVPVSMSVSGDSLTLTAEPGAEASWPVLVDPLFESFAWQTKGTIGAAGWTGASNSGSLLTRYGTDFGAEFPGLYLCVCSGSTPAGASAVWSNSVPRYAEDQAKGLQTTSYINHFNAEHFIYFGSPGAVNPWIYGGIWDPGVNHWAGKEGGYAAWSAPGNTLLINNVTLSYENGKPGERDQEAKIAYGLAAAAMEASTTEIRESYLGAATIEVADEGLPTVANPSGATSWINATATAPVTVDAVDTGLGVKAVKFEVPGQGTVNVSKGCSGVVTQPCPRTWTASLAAAQLEPSKMPQGEDKVTITAEDVLGNKTGAGKEAKALVKVDHTAPAIALSGTLTEQATLGTKYPTYTLKAVGTDGTEASPQSGVAKVLVELDGKDVVKKEAACATKNCSLIAEWTLEAGKYAAGAHTVKVTATDAVGLTTTKELSIVLNPEPPKLSVAGTITEQATLGTSRPQYRLRYTAADGTGPASPPLAGLVAAFSFDQGAGETAHDSVGNHNAKIEGAKWTSGRYGSALEFDASKKTKITVPDAEDLRLKGFTLEAWVSPKESKAGGAILAHTNPEDYGYALYANGEIAGHPEGLVTNHNWVSSYAYSGKTIPTATWSHLALTDDGQNLRLYINGELVTTHAATEVLAGKGTLLIGGTEAFGKAEYFSGKIDDVRVYNRALSAAELKTDKNNAIQSPPSGAPIASYNLNENTGTSALDYSSHGHTATINGAKWTASGKNGTALEFKASEKNILTVADSEYLRQEQFTLEGWVNPSETRTFAPIFAKVSSEGYGYALYAGGEISGHPEGIVTNNKTVSSYAYSSKTIPNGTWSHVALTDDGQNLRLYVNGELVNTHAAPEVRAGNASLQIGGTEGFGKAEYFSGKLDDLRIYPRPLSATEITKDMSSAVGTSPTETNVPTGVSSTEVSVDGGAIDSSGAKCLSENCFITREVTLDSSKYSAGKHNVVVKAVDALGNTSTQTIPIEIQKDTTKPAITLSGGLPSAPEGWVEQEHPYSFKAEASDAGYGVTSLSLKIDGATVASTSGACPEGACPSTLSKSVDTNALSGGAHAALVTATDGAGNARTETWIVNVDPSGQIGSVEATETLEAVEDTSAVNLVGAPEEEELEGTAEDLQLTKGTEGIEAQGTAAGLQVTGEGENACTIEMEALPPEEIEETEGAAEPFLPSEGSEEEAKEEAVEAPEEEVSFIPEGEPVAVSDTESPPGSLCEPQIAQEAAAVDPNSDDEVDSAIRPLYDGSLQFLAIRGPDAPEEYSWNVELHSGQTLKLLDSQNAEVYFADGTAAMSIAAEPAHDATGASVPTSLSVTGGNEITLHVPYGAGTEKGTPVVYPVVAGAGYEVGYSEVTFSFTPETEPQEEEVGAEVSVVNGDLFSSSVIFGPPEPAESDPEYANHTKKHKKRRRGYRFNSCREHANVVGVGTPDGPKRLLIAMSRQCHNEGPDPTEIHIDWAVAIYGKFWYRWGEEAWLLQAPECKAWGVKEREPTEKACWESGHAKKAVAPNHLDVLGDWRFSEGDYSGPSWGSGQEACFQLDGVIGTRQTATENGEHVLHDTKHEYVKANGYGKTWPCPWSEMYKFKIS